jgi:citrate synthase
MPDSSLRITDNRTGKTYDLKIADGAIKAMDLRQMQTDPEDFGLLAHDPAFTNTTSCKSRITFIDGDKGILEYRGYPISDLAERASFTEIAWALLNGDLPTKAQHDAFTADLMKRATLPANLLKTLEGMPKDGHPMPTLMALTSALGAYNNDARHVRDKAVRREHMTRLIAQMPLLGAAVWRHRKGLPQVAPRPELGYVGNFAWMVLAKDANDRAERDPKLVHALDVLFTLHADHEQNCSAATMRVIGSAEADPYSSSAGAIAALSGPLHGGANEEVLKMLAEIGDVSKIPAFLDGVKNKKAKLMGFGHRVYKSYDPRAKIIQKVCHEVFGVTGKNPKIDIAVELERIALHEKYFIERNLYPNVDFYSGLIYESLGFDPSYFTVLFAVPRTTGWLAQYDEMLDDAEQKIARPRQLYLGHRGRKVAPVAERQ